MDLLFKAIAGVLISVVLYHLIPSNRKELSLMLSIAASCMVCIAAMSYMKPILAFLQDLQEIGNLNSQMMSILTKSVGVGFVTEITVLICKDFGNGALGKSVQFLAITATLWIALPVFEELMSLIQNILILS